MGKNFEAVPYFAVQSVHLSGRRSPLAPWQSPMVPAPWGTPELVRKLYNVPDHIKAMHPKSSMSVPEFQGQFFSKSDLHSFAKRFDLPIPNISVVGPNDPSNPGGESTLDLQWITAMGPGVRTTYWSVPFPGFIIDWLAK